MHKFVYLPLAESDLMIVLGYIAYTLDALKVARDLLIVPIPDIVNLAKEQ